MGCVVKLSKNDFGDGVHVVQGEDDQEIEDEEEKQAVIGE